MNKKDEGEGPNKHVMTVPHEWQHIVSQVLITPSEIRKRISELAVQLSTVYSKQNPILIIVLKGSFLFASDLSRALPFEHEVEFIKAKSYKGTDSTGIVKISGLESANLTNRHVLVIEDIVDTGLTLHHVYDRLTEAGAASVKCCTLLEKDTVRRHKDSPKPDYVAFYIPDKFVLGYGLDLDQRFRHLPFVGVYKQP